MSKKSKNKSVTMKKSGPNRRAESVALKTPDFLAEQREQFRQLFPQVFTEGKIDIQKLRAAFDDSIDERLERYSFTWAGKRAAMLEIQKPAWGTLVPAKDESVNFDTTQNLFIEGENLEVLKLLYKSYFGRVKMIYIDPPYNTGGDFVYPDNFADPEDAYLKVTGQKDAEGNLLTSNPESSGRYHSAWLSMMYPRLFLARQFLRDDGLIFVSIDDHEVHNLRLLMNEIFGEENFIAQLIWEKGRKNDAKLFSVGHEYIVVFARSLARLKQLKTVWREPKEGSKEIWDEYISLRAKHGEGVRANKTIEAGLQAWYSNLPEKHPSKRLSRYRHVDDFGPWRDRDISWPGGGGPRYDVIHPKTKLPCKVPEAGWRFTEQAEMLRQIKLGLVEFRDDDSEPPFRKAHLKPIAEELDEDEAAPIDGNGDENLEGDNVGMQVMGSYIYKQAQVSVKYLNRLLGGKRYFDNPKDHEVLARLIRYCTAGNDLVFDFFSGVGSTAEAVVSANESDGSCRRYILVQIPQPTPERSNARKAGYLTISALAKGRIKKVIENVEKKSAGELQFNPKMLDNGISIFHLASSNFKPWVSEPDATPENLAKAMELFNDPLADGWKPENVIYEVAIKEGLSLTSRIEKIAAVKSNKIFRVTDTEKGQSFRICLDDEVKTATVKELNLKKDDLFICRDMAINDKTAANLALQCRLKTI